MMCADYRIDGTRRAAVEAADATRLIDDGHDRFRVCRLGERQDVPAQQVSQSLYGCVPTWRTQVDLRYAVNDGFCKRAATRVATLRALRLR
jgi:hypothetical protein